jgi:hypothetical protein
MPRQHRTSLFPVAVSPACAADALGIRAEQLQLRCYALGIRGRVLVADLTAWVRQFWNEVRHES